MGALRRVLAGRPSDAAPSLLGAVLVAGGVRATVVEVEAYEAVGDPASHAARGRTSRNAPMYERPGTLYVYRSYGLHWCANIVCGPVGEPGAVLLRAARVDDGLATAAARRTTGIADHRLAQGPGNLCAALGIDGSHDGTDVLDAAAVVALVPGSRVASALVLCGPRVGITKAVELPWRWAVAGERAVSAPRRSLVGAAPAAQTCTPCEPGSTVTTRFAREITSERPGPRAPSGKLLGKALDSPEEIP